jgi:hypothetical protein
MNTDGHGFNAETQRGEGVEVLRGRGSYPDGGPTRTGVLPGLDGKGKKMGQKIGLERFRWIIEELVYTCQLNSWAGIF